METKNLHALKREHRRLRQHVEAIRQSTGCAGEMLDRSPDIQRIRDLELLIQRLSPLPSSFEHCPQ